MKKFVGLLSSGLLAILLIFGAGNVAFAHEDDGCTCYAVPVYGAEKNKEIANVLKTDVFKDKKKELKNRGYQWQGAAKSEVVDFYESIEAEVPFKMISFWFVDKKGNELAVVFTKIDEGFYIPVEGTH